MFARKFGDCKDKASLLVVMLREIGVDASLVLARTRRGGDLDPEPASLAPFDHAIVYVPRYDLFLDGTAEFSGADELPAQDQDIPVLIVSEGKLRAHAGPAGGATTASSPTSAWRCGRAAPRASTSTSRIAGEVAHEWRAHYQSPAERPERYGKAWAQKHPGARVDIGARCRGSTISSGRCEVRAAVEVPDWAHASAGDGGELVMPALGREADMLRSYARLSSRKHDLVLGFPWRQEDRVTVTLPRGLRGRSGARGAHGRGAVRPLHADGDAEGRHRRGGGGARGRSPSHRARGLRRRSARFCADVDAAVGQELVVGK